MWPGQEYSILEGTCPVIVTTFDKQNSLQRYTETERKRPHAHVEHAVRTLEWSGGQFQTIR